MIFYAINTLEISFCVTYILKEVDLTSILVPMPWIVYRSWWYFQWCWRRSVLCKYLSYLRVNLAKVLIGFDSKKEDFRLRRRLIALLPSDNLDIKDWRRFKLALMLPIYIRTYWWQNLNWATEMKSEKEIFISWCTRWAAARQRRSSKQAR